MANKDDFIEKQDSLQGDAVNLQTQPLQSSLKADDENSVDAEHVESEQSSLYMIQRQQT